MIYSGSLVCTTVPVLRYGRGLGFEAARACEEPRRKFALCAHCHRHRHGHRHVSSIRAVLRKLKGEWVL